VTAIDSMKTKASAISHRTMRFSVVRGHEYRFKDARVTIKEGAWRVV
jgi:hypothetical protein